MPEGFIVELTVEDKKALRRIERFEKEANKRLERINASLGGGKFGSPTAKRHFDQQIRQQRKALDTLEQQRERSARNIRKIASLNDERLLSAARKTQQQLARIKRTGAEEELATRRRLNQRLESLFASERRMRFQQIQMQERQAAQMRQMRQFSGVLSGQAALQSRVSRGAKQASRDFSRWTMRTFQAQQAIEDFAFAGVRGATNNISLMASSLGGPAGLIALLGTTAVVLGPMIAKLTGLGESAKEAAERQKKLNQRLKDFLDLRKRSSKLLVQGIRTGKDPFAERSQEIKDRLFLQRQSVEVQGRIRREIKDVLDLERRRMELAEQIRLGGGTKQVISNFRITKRRLLEEARDLKQKFPSLITGDINEESRETVVKSVRDIKKNLKEATGQSEDRLRSLKVESAVQKGLVDRNQVRLEKSKQMNSVLEERVKLKDHIAQSEESALERLKRQRKERIQDMQKALKSSFKVELDDKQRPVIRFSEEEVKRLNKAFRDTGVTFEKGILDNTKALKNAMEIVESGAQRLNEEKQKEIDNLQRFLDKQEERINKAKELTQEKERFIKKQKQEIENQVEQMKNLRKQRSDLERETLLGRRGREDRFASEVFDVRMGNFDRFFRQAAERQMMQMTRMLQRQGAPAGMIAQKQRQMQQRLQMQFMERRRGMLEERAGFLSQRAQQAGAIGAFDRQEQLLQQLQQMQLQFAGQAPTPQIAQRAMEQARKTQERIQQAFQEEQKRRERLLQQERQSVQKQFDASVRQLQSANKYIDAVKQFRNAVKHIRANVSAGQVKPKAARAQLDEARRHFEQRTGMPAPFQHGGHVAGPGGIDRVPAMLTSGEVVLNRDQQQRIREMMGMPPERFFASLGVPGFQGGGVMSSQMQPRRSDENGPNHLTRGPLGPFESLGGGVFQEGRFLPGQIPEIIARRRRMAVDAFKRGKWLAKRMELMGLTPEETAKIFSTRGVNDRDKEIIMRKYRSPGNQDVINKMIESGFQTPETIMERIRKAFPKVRPEMITPLRHFFVGNVDAWERQMESVFGQPQRLAGGGQVPFPPAFAQKFQGGGMVQPPQSSVTNNTPMFSGANVTIQGGGSNPDELMRRLEREKINQQLRRGS